MRKTNAQIKAGMQALTRVFVLAENTIVGRGLRTLSATTNDIEIIGTADSVLEALERGAQMSQANVAIINVFDLEHGVDFIARLRREIPRLKILTLSMLTEPGIAVSSMRAGAHGFLDQHASAEDLLVAIRTLRSGRRYITPYIADLLTSKFLETEAAASLNELSERELRVFTRLALGIRSAAIATELGISVRTVSACRERINKKLNVHNNAELAAYAARNELVI